MTQSLRGAWPVQVYYEDTDSLGVVYHANYLKFFERAREHLVGIEWLKQINANGTLLVIRKLEMRFFAPSAYGDQLQIKTELQYSRSPRMMALQSAWRDESCLVKATIEIVAIDRNGQPMKLTAEALDYLATRA